MPTVPIVFTTPENEGFFNELQNRIIDGRSEKECDILLNYPTVYIHYWPKKRINFEHNGQQFTKIKYGVYVGESNNVIERTQEHYNNSNDAQNWQYHLTHDGEVPQMIVIGHEHFNKSFTLDVENQLIEYIMTMHSVEKIFNGRTNPQNKYYPSIEFNDVFHKIWSSLRKQKSDLFLSETEIKDSAIFKASPLKKLTEEQENAKNLIIRKIYEAYYNSLKSRRKQEGQLIFVQGEAGTGKTVLTTSTFYDLMKRNEDDDELPELSCHLMVNHDQQVTVYEQMARRLSLGDDVVSKPTYFINKYSSDNKVDVAFVDEGHLLWTCNKYAYVGGNQLKDIIERARVTVVMFDEYQILTTEQIWEAELLDHYKELSKAQGNYVVMKNQLRMTCAATTINWLDKFVLDRELTFLPQDANGYVIKSFDSPNDLQSAIKQKVDEGFNLSRVVATYDWPYNNASAPEENDFWEVHIGKWHCPWNYELEKTLTPREKKSIKNLVWAEQPQTINEIGSTFSIQGFDLSYVGVIIGPSVKYENGKIVFHPENSCNEKATRNRTLSDGTKKKFGEMLLRNELKVLLSRGVKGLYIYACDSALRKALKDIAKI